MLGEYTPDQETSQCIKHIFSHVSLNVCLGCLKEMSCLCWESLMNHTETQVWPVWDRPQGGWEQLTDSGPVSTMIQWCELMFVNIQQCFPLAKLFREILILWFMVAQHGTAFFELQAVLFPFYFLLFSQDKAENTVTNLDMITGFSCVSLWGVRGDTLYCIFTCIPILWSNFC